MLTKTGSRRVWAAVLSVTLLCSLASGCANGDKGDKAGATTAATTTEKAQPLTGYAVEDDPILKQPNTNPEPTAKVPVPAAAKAAGMTALAFADDFDSYDTIDFSGEGKPGYNWYADRPYKGVTLTKEEVVLKDGVMTLAPETCPSSIGLPTFSAKGKTGYAMHFGYAEARLRFDVENVGLAKDGRNGFPSFWGVSVVDVIGNKWNRVGELDILEVVQEDGNNPSSPVFYTGTLHDHIKLTDGSKKIGTNLVNATGSMGIRDYLDAEWHTYAALWTENYVAWYFDGELMHAVRFSEDELPLFYYRDFEDPIAWNETDNPGMVGRAWEGNHSIMNVDHMVLFLGAHKMWPMEVDWVRVWEAPAK